MWTCATCLKQAGKRIPKSFLIRSCEICNTPAVECALEATKVNNEVSNWHKYSEDNNHSSSSDQFEIPENGLYLWLRPYPKTICTDLGN